MNTLVCPTCKKTGKQSEVNLSFDTSIVRKRVRFRTDGELYPPNNGWIENVPVAASTGDAVCEHGHKWSVTLSFETKE